MVFLKGNSNRLCGKTVENKHKGTENLTPFQKGHPGMGGRPKGSISVRALLKKMSKKQIDFKDPFNRGEISKRSIKEGIALRILFDAFNGNMKAIQTYLEYVEGKPVQTVDIGNKNGEAFRQELNITPVDVALSNLVSKITGNDERA